METTKFCDRCGVAEATHLVISDILRMPVCADCAAAARALPDLRVKKWAGHQAIPIELTEEVSSILNSKSKIQNRVGAEFRLVVLTPFQRVLAASVRKA